MEGMKGRRGKDERFPAAIIKNAAGVISIAGFLR
jgi:hypothetical protein